MFNFNIFGNRMTSEALCNTCVHAHVAVSDAGERLTSCVFGGTLRSISFEVVDCSSFFDRRNVRSTVVSGFLDPREAA